MIEHSTYLPIELVLDVSPSMASAADAAWNPPIDDLNEALRRFVLELRSVQHCAIEVMTITFAEDVVIEHDFENVATLATPECTVRGEATDLGGAIARALDEAEARRDFLRASGYEVMQPWLVCVTDGQPNRNSSPGLDVRLVDLIRRRKCHFLPVAVGGYAAYPVLEALSPLQPPIVVSSSGAGSLSFAEFFRFLSDSIARGEDPNLADLGQSHAHLTGIE